MKAIIWNQLKALGYTAQQLKLDTGLTYAQVTKEQLEAILEATEKGFETDVSNWRETVTKKLHNEIESTCAVEVTGNELINAEVNNQFAVVLGGGNTQEQVPLPDSLVLSFNYEAELFKQMQLTPKLSLFSSITEWCYLMYCFDYLLSLQDNYVNCLDAEIFSIWFTIVASISKGYVKQPMPSIDDYMKLLQINHQNKFQLV